MGPNLKIRAGLGKPEIRKWEDTVVNVSRINDYLRCNRRWYNQYLMNRVADTPDSEAQKLGRLVHACLERVHLGYPDWDLPCKEVEQELLDTWGDWLEAVVKAYRLKQKLWGYSEEILGTEQELWIAIDVAYDTTVYIVGRADLIAVKAGKTRHVQLKTVSRTVDPNHFAAQTSFSLHEAVYGEAISRIYDKPYMGTELIMVNKIQPPSEPVNTTKDGRITEHYRKKLDKYEHDKDLYLDRLVDRRMVVMPEELRMQLIWEALDSIMGMEAIEEGVRPAVRAGGGACHRYGRACQYLDVCSARALLEGPGFQNREFDYVDEMS